MGTYWWGEEGRPLNWAGRDHMWGGGKAVETRRDYLRQDLGVAKRAVVGRQLEVWGETVGKSGRDHLDRQGVLV